MPEEMQQIAVAATKEAPRKHTLMKDVAALIKGNFEPRDNPTWDCVVSSNFDSFFTHETKLSIYIYLGQIA